MAAVLRALSLAAQAAAMMLSNGNVTKISRLYERAYALALAELPTLAASFTFHDFEFEGVRAFAIVMQ
jgi:hypothetical protein